MKQLIPLSAILIVIGLASSCSTTNPADPNAPRATVYLRDGTSFAGAVKSSSAKEITLAGDDNNSRTFDMKNVRSIEYADTAGTAPPAAAPPAAPSSAPAPSRAVIQQPRPPRDHPEESHINTKTYVLPVGTEVSVRTD